MSPKDPKSNPNPSNNSKQIVNPGALQAALKHYRGKPVSPLQILARAVVGPHKPTSNKKPPFGHPKP